AIRSARPGPPSRSPWSPPHCRRRRRTVPSGARAGCAATSRGWITEDEARAANRVQKRWTSNRIQLPPDASNVHVDQVGQAVVARTPALIQQHAARHELARMANQALEDGELLDGDRDGCAAPCDPKPAGIVLDVRAPEDRRFDRPDTAC